MELAETIVALEEYLPFGRPNFSPEEIEGVVRVLRSGWVGMGPETGAFERELADYLGARHVVAVNSCTSALFLSLLVHGIGEGDEVICPSLTWCSTANAALYLGATPVFCDVDPDSLCVSPESVQKKLSARTKAVIVVHFGGLAAQIDKIRELLPEHVVIIEDAAHALGASFPDGTKVGASGNLTCFSFYANKNLSTGDGGAIALNDTLLADRLRSLSQQSMPANAWKRFTQPKNMPYTMLTELGYKMNYTDLQAAIGRVQLKRQPEFQALRLDIADYYYQELNPLKPGIGFQRNITQPDHARHLFPVFLPIEDMTVSRDEFLLDLRSMNVGASVHYAPLHTMPLYAHRRSARLTYTERLSRRILTLPISASMRLLDARFVVEAFVDAFRRAIG